MTSDDRKSTFEDDDGSGKPMPGNADAARARIDSISNSLVHSFGITVRQLREARGWSQERLAEESNLNRSYVGEIERGCAASSLTTVEKLALALDLAPSALVSHSETVRQINQCKGISLMAIAC